MKTITIWAKTADCFGMDTDDGQSYDGYPPRFLGDGDSIELTIDIATGKVVGWDAKKVVEELKDCFEEGQDDE